MSQRIPDTFDIIPQISLTDSQLQELIDEYQATGSPQAQRLLVYATNRVAFKVAQKWHRRTGGRVSADDLRQEALTGLLRALQIYDQSHGLSLIGYVKIWARQRCSRYCVYNYGGLTISKNHDAEKVFYKGSFAKETLESNGEIATWEAIADKLEVKPEIVRNVMMAMSQVLLDSKPAAIAELIAGADASPTPEQDCVTDSMMRAGRELLAEFRSKLNEKEAAVWDRHICAIDSPESFASMARDFGVTRERMRQICVALWRRWAKWINLNRARVL